LFLGEKGGRLQASILQKALRALRMAYGMPEHVAPHGFRHSFASHLLDGGASLRDVQELLGRTCVRATQVYTQATQKPLQGLHQSSHPHMIKGGAKDAIRDAVRDVVTDVTRGATRDEQSMESILGQKSDGR
jgi:site-specific recombinase XerC